MTTDLPRMFRVWHKKEYIGLVCATSKTVLKEAINLFRCYGCNKRRTLKPDDLTWDDSLAEKYRHMM